jgi:hypothetical protein
MSHQPRPKPVKPTDTNFDTSLGLRYAEELRQRQAAGQFGAMHNTSHNLGSEDLLSNMVMQGLNNLAHVTLSMQRDRQQRQPAYAYQEIPEGKKRHFA